MVQWEASEEDLEKLTMSPIEKPESDDCFAKVISHLKENYKKHQLRKEAFDPLPVIHLPLLTMEEQEPSTRISEVLDEGEYKRMPYYFPLFTHGL